MSNITKAVKEVLENARKAHDERIDQNDPAIWTNLIPTKPGWYWRKQVGQIVERATIIHVTIYDDGEILFDRCTAAYLQAYDPRWGEYEWQGPVLPT